MFCQSFREKLSGFGWLTWSTVSLWSLVKKTRATTFFWLKIRALVNFSIMHVLPMQWKIQSDLPLTHTLEIWHTSKGNKKSSNLWLDPFHQMEQEKRFQWSSVCAPSRKVNLDESIYTFINHSMNNDFPSARSVAFNVRLETYTIYCDQNYIVIVRLSQIW